MLCNFLKSFKRYVNPSFKLIAQDFSPPKRVHSTLGFMTGAPKNRETDVPRILHSISKERKMKLGINYYSISN